MGDLAEKYLERESPKFMQYSVPLMEKKKMHLRIASVYGKSTNILQITV